MPGLSDFEAEAFINHATGAIPLATPASRYLALFTAAPTSDAGTGGTEVSGGSYARVQVAGAVAATASFTTSSPDITMASNPGWVVPGMNVYDLTSGQQIGTVQSYVGTALVLTGNAAHASSGSTDSLQFSAWPAASGSTGSEPSTSPANVTNGAAVAFAQSTAAWASGSTYVNYWGIYDALTSGDYLWGDYFGNYKWSPFTATNASPSVLTCTDQTFANGEFAVVTAKFGGTLPTTGGSWAGVQTVAGLSGSTFNLGVNSTGAGDGMVRQVIQYSISVSTLFSLAASSFTLQLA